MEKHGIGKSLQKLRQDMNLTQKELAGKVNLSRSTISRMEQNQSLITLDDLLIILSFYNISVNSFLESVSYGDSIILNLVESFNRICCHFYDFGNKDISIIKSDILKFKNLFETLESTQLFDVRYDIQWFVQLPKYYPKFFNKPNENLLSKYTEFILTKENWYESDFNFLANSIPFLNVEAIDNLYKIILQTNYTKLPKNSRKLFEYVLENTSDFFLVHYAEFGKEKTEKILSQLFNYWEIYLDTFKSIENRIIFNHNYNMYEFLFEKKDKEIIMSECEKRSQALNSLNLNELSSSLLDEAQNYYNEIYGNLTFNLSY